MYTLVDEYAGLRCIDTASLFSLLHREFNYQPSTLNTVCRIEAAPQQYITLTPTLTTIEINCNNKVSTYLTWV